MTTFGPVRMASFDDHAVDHDAATDSRAQGKHHLAAVVLAGSDPKFAIGRGVGVVLQGCRLLQPIGQQFANRKVIPSWQVGRVQEHPGCEVHGPWRAKADGGNPIPVESAFRHGLVGRLDEAVKARSSTLLGVGFDTDR